MSVSDSLATGAGSGRALARTGATHVGTMVVAGLIAMVLGAMMLIPAASENGRRRPRSQARFPA